jgi:hypothetical protein
MYMSKRPRRNHSPVFKAKVALDALTACCPNTLMQDVGDSKVFIK